MADSGALASFSVPLTPISELNPSSSSTNAIKAIVALLWPYSVSKRSLTLLLVEPDFRLRRDKGQVRVEFHGSSAQEVARSGIISGDELVLSLHGAEWSKDDAVGIAPGRGIDWKLDYGEVVSLQVDCVPVVLGTLCDNH